MSILLSGLVVRLVGFFWRQLISLHWSTDIKEQHPFYLANAPDLASALHLEEPIVRQSPQQVELAPRRAIECSVFRLLAVVGFDWMVVSTSARGLSRVVSWTPLHSVAFLGLTPPISSTSPLLLLAYHFPRAPKFSPLDYWFCGQKVPLLMHESRSTHSLSKGPSSLISASDPA
jgi:hypothetical protein